MDWHLRLAEAAPGFSMVRLLNCWVLDDPDGNKVGQFRTCDEAIAKAKWLAQEKQHGCSSPLAHAVAEQRGAD